MKILFVLLALSVTLHGFSHVEHYSERVNGTSVSSGVTVKDGHYLEIAGARGKAVLITIRLKE